MSGRRSYRYYALGVVISVITVMGVVDRSFAQTVVNGTTVYIPDGLEVHIDGDVSNAGFLQNLGIVYLTGDWKNTSVYQGAGTIVMQGDREQNIANNKNAVYKLVIDGTGNKSIEDKLPVTHQLELRSGIVVVQKEDTLLLSSMATVTGGSPFSYVDGALFSEGVGYKFFPIGKNGNYHPVELADITGISPVISLEVFENLPSINAPSGITLYRDIFWRREDVSGMFEESPVVIGYTIPDNRTNTHQIDILQADDFSETFTTIGKTSVEFDPTLDKVMSEERSLSGKIFVLGESIPVGGVEGSFYLSNSLSPRATTEENRTIKVFGNQLEPDGFQFVVYNRWGLQVFLSESLQDMILKGWDGRSSGDFLPAGAYPYILKARMKNGEKLERKGVISIVN
jgi:hypothetical protein